MDRNSDAELLRSRECLDLALRTTVLGRMAYGGLNGVGERPNAYDVLLGMLDRFPASESSRLRTAVARGHLGGAIQDLEWMLHVELWSLVCWEPP